MEEGVLTDSTGRKVSFKNSIVVMTSNLGSGRNDMETVGFLAKGSGGTGKALREYFPPEFLGRLDCITVFKPLSSDVLGRIASKELAATQQRAALAGVELCTDGAAEFLAQNCADGRAGARELRRRIRRDVEGPAAEKLLLARGGLRLRTAVCDGELVLVED
jgi:ATP-dependent Clp protease ATP-binding subunit ClpA